MIASFLINPGTRQHGLDSVVFTELGFEKISTEDLIGKGRDKITFSEVPREKLGIYSCEDADFTNRLLPKLQKELKSNKLMDLFTNIEMPLVKVLADMEEIGIKIDVEFLEKMNKKMQKRIKALEKDICAEAGCEFNIKSTKQLAEVLFEKMEIPSDNIKKTKTGISTAADELEKLREEYSIVALIQEYRELTKLTSTYIESLPGLINKKTNRIHTSFNQTVAATGRLSSSDPNLQNIPVRTELGRKIRKAFISDKGKKLLALDYSQIELRLAAHLSGDKKMIKAFEEGADIHASTAAEINQVKLEDVTKQMRSEAKAINFGILYGQGPHGLAKVAGIPYYRAKDFIDQYFISYDQVRKYIDESIKEAQEHGYTETLLGRRRYLPEINSSVVMVRKAAERMAVNTPLQGTAADMIKKAMIEVARVLEKKAEADMLVQVHDELILEVEEDKVMSVAREVKGIMENILKLKVPIIVEAKSGNNWGEMEKIKF
jgi:DNA polymerase-1